MVTGTKKCQQNGGDGGHAGVGEEATFGSLERGKRFRASVPGRVARPAVDVLLIHPPLVGGKGNAGIEPQGEPFEVAAWVMDKVSRLVGEHAFVLGPQAPRAYRMPSRASKDRSCASPK